MLPAAPCWFLGICEQSVSNRWPNHKAAMYANLLGRTQADVAVAVIEAARRVGLLLCLRAKGVAGDDLDKCRR